MKRWPWIAVLLALALYAWTGITQVQSGERALVRWFGRVVTVAAPGLRLGLPLGLERVDRVMVDRIQRLVVGFQPDQAEDEGVLPPGQLLSGDHNLVDVQIVLEYVVDADHLDAYVLHRDAIDNIAARAVEAVLSEWIAGKRVDDVLLRGKMDLPNYLVARLQAVIAPYEVGILVRAASIAYLLPPVEVRQAFDEVTRAQTAVRAQENRARQEAASRRRESESEKTRIEKMAQAHVQEQLLMAVADADRFENRLKQYRTLGKNNPAYLSAIWWDETGKLLAKLKENGRIDLLDHHLGTDGLDITVMPVVPGVK